eukprot:CAMPEP_0170551992 /NCGR_PEP_ID=MMETSP0211-20121228/9974_1 /TAXON_ID=311385 /ORGANISM="Pseudokeronopsis sp., Strain OXSARD2" /LENGTH=387 /DNA_ID=CAMNT_0010859499 /DNA_START=410 /DNA_END=1573 /DNA_ORIENTATION=-
MARAYQHLWGQVLCRPAEGVRQLVLGDHLRQPKVCQVQIPILSKEDVLWLQVPVDDALRVQVADGNGDLRYKETHLVLMEPLDLYQVSEEFSSFDEFHKEVDAELALEDILHVYNERVVDVKEDVLLQLNVLKLLIINDYIFSDALHGEDLGGVLVLHQEHLPEGPLPNHLPDQEVRKLHLVLLPGEDQVPLLLDNWVELVGVFLFVVLFVLLFEVLAGLELLVSDGHVLRVVVHERPGVVHDLPFHLLGLVLPHQILILHAELDRRELGDPPLHVLLGRGELRELRLAHPVDRQVLMHLLHEPDLQNIQNLLSPLGDEPVVVLGGDVHHELGLAIEEGLGDAPQLADEDRTLHLRLLQIINLLVRNHDYSVLDPVIHIYLLYFVRK